VPERPLPAYAYVPGRHPHPTRDPAGHSHGAPAARPDAPAPESWHANRTYLYGIDLFNHGYYWEAHEAWEALWHACGRRGTAAELLKGLIALAAAGFKLREGLMRGVRRHGARAEQILGAVAAARDGGPRYLGLDLAALVRFAGVLAREESGASPGPEARLALVLAPRLPD